jgi:hypothetical protein
MTATTTAAPERAAPRPGWFRSHRAGLLVGTAVVLATAGSILLGNRPAYSGGLDPGNTGPDGARAVARVLADEGVEVDVVRDADALDAATIDGSTMVVVTSVGDLGRSTVDRLLDDAGDAPVLLVDPPVRSTDLFGLDAGSRVRDHGPVASACRDPRLAGLSLRTDRATAFPGTTDACFRTADGALLVTGGSRSVSVLGAGDLLTNGQVTRADNAAIALRLLGARDHLVWYVPDAADLLAGDSVGLRSLLPDWLGPGVWLAALAVLALILWRGRRLGPLVSEPLPVTVTAIESTRSRGRLYRKVNDRAHAAATLRAAARSRIARHLHLPRAAAHDPEALVAALARSARLDPEHVRHLLAPDSPVPRTDKDLTQLASDLAELDREARRP